MVTSEAEVCGRFGAGRAVVQRENHGAVVDRYEEFQDVNNNNHYYSQISLNPYLSVEAIAYGNKN